MRHICTKKTVVFNVRGGGTGGWHSEVIFVSDQLVKTSLRAWGAPFPATFFRQMSQEVLRGASWGYMPRQQMMLFQINI